MKKLVLVVAMLACFLGMDSIEYTESFIPAAEPKATFKLPASLLEIEEEAFMYTAEEEVILPSSISFIGDRAFAYNENLRIVHVPESVSYIGDHTFIGSDQLTIEGKINTYAFDWAQRHDVHFVQNPSGSAWVDHLRKLYSGSLILSISLCFMNPKVQLRQRKKTEYRERSERQQDRPELYPIEYKFP